MSAAAFVCWLREWQELAGAALGALMGFIGAWVVASNVSRRERRNAARLMIMDMAMLERRYKRIQADRQNTSLPYQVFLADELTLEPYQLSPLFAEQSVQMMELGVTLSVALVMFTDVIAQLDRSLRAVKPTGPHTLREEGRLIQSFDRLHDLCRLCVYLLAPPASTLPRRLQLFVRRKVAPTPEERHAQQELARIREATKAAKQS